MAKTDKNSPVIDKSEKPIRYGKHTQKKTLI